MEEIILAKGTKEEKYESLFPQLEALWAGEDDLIANMANTVAAIKHQQIQIFMCSTKLH
jgi:GAF domain-containing protein